MPRSRWLSDHGAVVSVVPATIVRMPTPTTGDLLEFEARYPNHPRGKQEAIETELGLTVARYYQLLSRAIEDPRAEQLDPMLIHRLRRLRDRADERHRARMSTRPSSYR